MKTPSLTIIIAFLILSLQAGWAADAEKKDSGASSAKGAKSVRLRFVPKAHEGNGASVTELHPFPTPDSKQEAVQAWSGVGDSFPVREKGGKTQFEVAVVDGNDARLESENRGEGSPHKVPAVRDQRAPFKAAGRDYALGHLSVSGNSADKATTEQAMIIVSRER